METADIKKSTQYWLNSAQYDLETAKSLISAKRFPHALFFGHLAVEKLLKAIFVKHNKKHAPYTHSLPLLAEKSGIEISDKILDQLAEIAQYNMEARYPDIKDDFYKKATGDFTIKKFKEIEEIFQWFLQGL